MSNEIIMSRPARSQVFGAGGPVCGAEQKAE